MPTTAATATPMDPVILFAVVCIALFFAIIMFLIVVSGVSIKSIMKKLGLQTEEKTISENIECNPVEQNVLKGKKHEGVPLMVRKMDKDPITNRARIIIGYDDENKEECFADQLEPASDDDRIRALANVSARWKITDSDDKENMMSENKAMKLGLAVARSRLEVANADVKDTVDKELENFRAFKSKLFGQYSKPGGYQSPYMRRFGLGLGSGYAGGDGDGDGMD